MTKFQVPITELNVFHIGLIWLLEFGHWLLFGAWNLVIGILIFSVVYGLSQTQEYQSFSSEDVRSNPALSSGPTEYQ